MPAICGWSFPAERVVLLRDLEFYGSARRKMCGKIEFCALARLPIDQVRQSLACLSIGCPASRAIIRRHPGPSFVLPLTPSLRLVNRRPPLHGGIPIARSRVVSPRRHAASCLDRTAIALL